MRTKKPRKLHITEKDFMLANRRAARMEDIAAHGKTQCAGSTPGVGV